MAANRLKFVFKRKRSLMEESSGSSYYLRKRRKVDYSTNGVPECTKHVKEHSLSDDPIHMDESSSEFPRLSQEELKKIYGKRRQRPVIRKNSTEESEESEEEEGLTEEELKQTEGYQSLMKCLRIIAQQQSG